MPYQLVNRNFLFGNAGNNPNLNITNNGTINGIIRNILNSDNCDERLGNLTIVVPTSKLVRRYKNAIISLYSRKFDRPLSPLNIYSFRKFTRKIFDELIGVRVISDAYSFTLFEEAVNNADLQYFKKISSGMSNSQFIKQLFLTISGLRKDGITSQNANEELAENGDNSLSRRSADLFKIEKEYENLLADDLCDENGIMLRLNDYLKIPDNFKKFNYLFAYSRTILFDQFSNFREPECKFMQFLANSDAGVACQIDFNEKTGPLLSGLDDTILKLSTYDYSIREINDKDEQENRPATFLRNNLFLLKPGTEKTVLFNGMLRIIALQNPNEEVKLIAKLIKKLNIENKIALSDICICYRTPQDYVDIFRDTFYRYNIPVNITDRENLSSVPFVVSLFAFLDICLNGYKFEDIKSAFSARIYPDENSDSPINLPHSLNVTAQKYRIEGGFENGGIEQWKTVLDYQKSISQDTAKSESLINFLQTTFADYERNTEISPQKFRLLVEHLLKLYRIDKRSKVAFDELKHQRNTGIITQIEAALNFDCIEKTTKAYSAFIQILDEFVGILEERSSQQLHNLQYYAERFRIAVSGKRYQIREKTNYGVTITSIEQTRGIPFKVMILCGMSDNRFPLAFHTDVILGKSLRNTEMRHFIDERLLFYKFLTNNEQALINKSKRIFLTFPLFDSKGSNIRRSSYIDYILNITDVPNVYLPGNLDMDDDNSAEQKIFDMTRQDKQFADSFMNELKNSVGSKMEYMQKTETISASIIKNLATIRRFNNADRISFLEYDKLPQRQQARLRKFTEYNESNESNTFSPTELDGFITCPEKYFIERILKIRKEEELDDSLSPLELGTLVHNILYKFYTENQSATPLFAGSEIFPVNLKSENKDVYSKQIKEIARNEVTKLGVSNPFILLDQQSITGNRQFPGILDFFLENQLNGKNVIKAVPGLFEYKIQNFLLKIGGNIINMRGKIDRVEFKFDEQARKLEVVIGDYKSGESSVNKKDSLQLVLYLKMIIAELKEKHWIPQDVEIREDDNGVPTGVSVGGIWYFYNNRRTKSDNNSKTQAIQFLDGESKQNEPETVIAEKLAKVSEIIENIVFGNFPATKKSCPQYCNLAPICRKR